jgi:hypothetical protein
VTIDEAVEKLDSLSKHGDTESDHGFADDILLKFVPQEIADAYNRARDRVGFWYA